MFADNFQGSSLNTRLWGAYSGEPGGDPSAWWDPSHVTVSGGVLHLTTSWGSFGSTGKQGWVSGGIGSLFDQTYGTYEVRMRSDAGAGISVIALLWPTVGWPPEIDFFEDAPADNARDHNAATLHYGPSNNTIQRSVSGIDFTHWHTVGVEWSPGRLVYTIDGTPWATVNSAHVPNVPMSLDIQTQYIGGVLSAPTPASSSTEVAWVVEYANNN